MGAQLSTRTKSSKSSSQVAKKLVSKTSGNKTGKGSSRPAPVPKNQVKAKPVKASAPAKTVAAKVTAKTKAVPTKPIKVVATKPKTKPVIKAPVTVSAKAKTPEKIVKPIAKAVVRVQKIIAPPPAPKAKPAPKAAKPISRQILTSQALSAFEKALKLFNLRDFSQAKQKFEDLHLHFQAEVEIIARSQTYIQICETRLASQNSVPKNADECYDRGIVALNVGDFLQAKTLFEKALKLRPDDSHTLYSLAATLAQTNAIEQSLNYLGQAVQKHPRLRQRALNDSDFSPLKEDRRFLDLLGASSPFDLLEARRELS